MEQRTFANMEKGDWLEAAAEPLMRSLIAQLKVEYQIQFKKAFEASGHGRGLLEAPSAGGAAGERRHSGGSLSPTLSPARRGASPWGSAARQQSPGAEIMAGTITNGREGANDGTRSTGMGATTRRRLSGRAAGGFSRNTSGEQDDLSPKSFGARARRGASWLSRAQSGISYDMDGSNVSQMPTSRSVRSRNSYRSASSAATGTSARSRSGLTMINSNSNMSAGGSGCTNESTLTEHDIKTIQSLRNDDISKVARAQRRLSTNWSSVVVGIRTMSVPGLPESSPKWRKVPHRLLTWPGFDMVMGVVIIVNALMLGIETSAATQGERIPTFALVSEYIFLLIYIIELCLRFCAMGMLKSFRNGWVRLDVILVLAGLVNFGFTVASVSGTTAGAIAGNFNMLKLLRLFRLARTLRIFVQFRHLWLLVSGLMYAIMPMVWTCFIMVAVIYVFAIVGMEFIGDLARTHANDEFRTLWDSMMFLLQTIFVDNAVNTWKPLVSHSPAMLIYFASFFLIGPVALMNIVTAIMVESSIRTATEDVEAKKAWKAIQRKEMMPKLHNLFGLIDVSGSGVLDFEQFIAAPEEVQEQISRIVDLEFFESIFDLLDADRDGVVTADEFAEGIMRSWQEGKPAELTLLVKQQRRILNKLCSMVQSNQDKEKSNKRNEEANMATATDPLQLVDSI